MQLALIILAGLGALIFILCFLGYVISGFRHHFVTGLIAILPVLNIVTLPSLWDKNSRKFLFGLFGLIIAFGSWFMGADKGIQDLLSRGNDLTNEQVTSSSVLSNTSSVNTQSATISNNATVTTIEKPKRISSYNESKMFELPKQALYKLNFDVVPVNQINSLQGRIVQITNNQNEIVEGRIKRFAPGSVVLDGLFENELPIASIKQLKLMVKKSNQ